jgi:hypothetical protein
MRNRRGTSRVLVGKPEGKRPLGRPRRGWEDNIKMDLKEVGNLKERDHLEDLIVDGRIILKRILK